MVLRGLVANAPPVADRLQSVHLIAVEAAARRSVDIDVLVDAQAAPTAALLALVVDVVFVDHGDARQAASVGSGSSDTGTQFEPFEAAFQNTYLLQAGRMGGMATYEMYYQYQEIAARLFGGFVNFEFNPVTKKITLLRKFSADGEQIVLWTYNLRPEARLLQDRHAGPWVQDYALALAKYTLGEARSKFSTIAGPQGGTSLNGDALKAEAQVEIDKLDEELRNYVDGSDPLSFIIG